MGIIKVNLSSNPLTRHHLLLLKLNVVYQLVLLLFLKYTHTYSVNRTQAALTVMSRYLIAKQHSAVPQNMHTACHLSFCLEDSTSFTSSRSLRASAE